MRFSVRSHTQNVLFRETAPRLPSSGKAHSTERRILCRHPHGKAHPRPATSQKSALWTRSVPRRDPSLTEKRTLRSTLSASPCRTLCSTLFASPCRTLRAAPCGSPRYAPSPCALPGMHCDLGDDAADPSRSRYPTPAGYTSHHGNSMVYCLDVWARSIVLRIGGHTRWHGLALACSDLETLPWM